MKNKTAALIQQWLSERAGREHTDWLQSQVGKILSSNSDRELHITLGLIPRKLGRADLALATPQLADASALVPDWNPSCWSIDTAARIMVLCELAETDPEGFGDTITDLCRNADLAESIALYSGIALYPHSDKLNNLIGEGLRTNMRAVFEAIAHYNPYPARHFDENRWNHMVLKALFIDSTLSPIQGLDDRSNKELATILCDYAHERWAAGRAVTVELWRCVGTFASGTMIDDLKKVAESGNPLEHQAGVLALTQCNDPRALAMIDHYQQTTKDIANGIITWDAICSALTPQSGSST